MLLLLSSSLLLLFFVFTNDRGSSGDVRIELNLNLTRPNKERSEVTRGTRKKNNRVCSLVKPYHYDFDAKKKKNIKKKKKQKQKRTKWRKKKKKKREHGVYKKRLHRNCC